MADTTKIMKLRIDGIDFEVPENSQLMQAWEKATKERRDAGTESKTKIDSLNVDLAKANARADEAEAKLKVKTDELSAAPEKIRSEFAAHSKLVATAAGILGADAKVDGKGIDEMKSAEIKKAVILNAYPEAVLEGKADAYIDARFDSIVETFSEGILSGRRELLTAKVDDLPRDPDLAGGGLTSAEQAFAKASHNAYKIKKSA